MSNSDWMAGAFVPEGASPPPPTPTPSAEGVSLGADAPGTPTEAPPPTSSWNLIAPPDAERPAAPPDLSAAPYKLAFFDIIAPVERRFRWLDQQWTVLFRLLQDGDDDTVQAFVRDAQQQGHDPALAARRITLALSVLEINKRDVTADFPTVDHRLEWTRTMPRSLRDALYAQYQAAEAMPLGYLDELMADPNSGPAPFTSGASWSGAGF